MTTVGAPDTLGRLYVGDVFLRPLADERAARARLVQLQQNPLVEFRPDRGHTREVPTVVWDIVRVPNGLLVSQPGAGKTRLMCVMCNELLLHDRGRVAMVLCDGKEVGSFYIFEGIPGVRIANDRLAIVQVIREVAAEVDRRRRLLSRYRREAARGYRRTGHPYRPGWWRPPPLLCLWIDDYIGWLLLLDDKALVEEVVRLLGLVAFQGREVRVRLLLAMQTAHAKAFDVGLSPQIKMSSDARFGVPGDFRFDTYQARMLYDDPQVKDRIPAVRGGGLFRVGAAEAALTVPLFEDPTDPMHTFDSLEELQALWGLIAA
jgi:hypothetical protein